MYVRCPCIHRYQRLSAAEKSFAASGAGDSIQDIKKKKKMPRRETGLAAHLLGASVRSLKSGQLLQLPHLLKLLRVYILQLAEHRANNNGGTSHLPAGHDKNVANDQQITRIYELILEQLVEAGERSNRHGNSASNNNSTVPFSNVPLPKTP